VRQLLVVGSVVGILSLAAPADAGERGWYLGLEGGIETDGNGASGDWGFAGLASAGHGVTSNLNLELEFGYRATTVDEQNYDIDQTSLMLNAVFDVPVTDEISLSLGLGLGVDRVQADMNGFELGDEVEVASQLKLGASWDIGDGTELVTNYRYMEMITDSGISNSTLTVGLRFDL
jgi:opacity protein-like surface antigen